MYTFRLASRRRIRVLVLAIESVEIKRSRLYVPKCSLMIASFVSFERENARRRRNNVNLDLLCQRCPYAKSAFVFTETGGA